MSEFHPKAPGYSGNPSKIGIELPTFNRFLFDAETFNASQETDRETHMGDDGKRSGVSHANQITILTGEMYLKAGSTETAKPPNVGEWAQIKGGDPDYWFEDSTNVGWWLECTASEIVQTIDGRPAKVNVTWEYNQDMHIGMENEGFIGIVDIDDPLA